jgi:hypothetical protein
MVVDDDNGADYEQYYTATIFSIRRPYDIWDVSQSGTPGAGDLNEYPVVIWFVGDYRDNPLGETAVAAMQSFLDNGGNLFLSGQGIAKQLSEENPDFLSQYLKSSYITTEYMPIVRVHESSPTFGGLTDDIVHSGTSGADNLTNPDFLAAVNGGFPELYYAVYNDIAAVSYTGSYKLMFFGAPMEAIISETSRFVSRDTILNRVLTFLDVDLTPGFPEVLSSEVSPGDSLYMIDHSPEISWSYYDARGALQDSFHVQVGTDLDWNAAEAWDYGPNRGADSQVTYSGEALSDGVTYFFRVRAFNGTQWSNWRRARFRMNSVPSSPAGLEPNNLKGVTSTVPDLIHQNAIDPEHFLLTYDYRIYADSMFSDVIAQADSQQQGTGTSAWTVIVPLQEDSVYYWRVRAFDNYEYGIWSDPASFWVNADNQPPASFELVSPADEALLVDMRPEFAWSSSGDPDRLDTVRYAFVWSTEMDFAPADTIAGLTDTIYAMDDSLSFGNLYYWKIIAYDDFGGITESDRLFTFTTWILGDASGDGNVNVGDAVFLINFIFKGGTAPDPLRVGDMNQDCEVTIGDAVYLINYTFEGGPPPLVGCE